MLTQKTTMCLTAALAFGAVWADSTWKGDRFSGDWNAAGNWEGGVPTGNATATIEYNSQCRALALTPPASFTGTIVCQRDNRDWAHAIATMLKLTVPDGAAWKVAGDGHLYATEGIAERIAPEFTGLVVVQNGMSFTALSSLNDAVEFAGDGTLTLTKASQLAHLAGFTGRVIWAGDGALSPEDTTLLQGRTVEFGDGAKLGYTERSLSLNASRPMADFADASAWQFNSNGALPQVNETGELELLDDSGEIATAVFKEHRFSLFDAWSVHMTCSASSAQSGSLCVCMAADTTTLGSSLDLPVPCGSAASGFSVKLANYANWWVPNLEHASSIPFDGRAAIDGGITFTADFEMDVSYRGGRMTVTLTQDGKTFSMQRHLYNSIYSQQNFPNGYYLAIGASRGGSTTWRIRNFRGWYQAYGAGSWASAGDPADFYPITADKWFARVYTDDGVYTEGASVINADGSFTLQPAATYRRTVLGLKTALKWGQRYLVDFDFEHGNGSGSQYTENLSFGFTLTPSSWATEYWGWDPLGNRELNAWVRPYMFTVNPYKGQAYFYCYKNTWVNGDKFEKVSSSKFEWPKDPRNTTIHFQMLWDKTAGSIDLRAWNTKEFKKYWLETRWMPPAGTFSRTDSTSPDKSLHLAFADWTSWGYVETKVKNITVKELTDTNPSVFTGTLAVAPDAKAEFAADAFKPESDVAAVTLGEVKLGKGAELDITTAAAGTKVCIKAVEIAGGDGTLAAATPTQFGGRFTLSGEPPAVGLTLSGVTLANDELTVVVPKNDLFKQAKCVLLNLAASDLQIDPAKVRIVREDGRDLTGKSTVAVEDGNLVAYLGSGMMILVQ